MTAYILRCKINVSGGKKHNKEVKKLSFAFYAVIADKLLRKKCVPYD